MASPEDPRTVVVECERQIQKIKTALRKIATEGGEETQNSLKVVWVGIDASDSEEMTVSMQLSSPVEEATLSKVQSSSGDEAVEVSSASFAGVESSMATLTVTLMKGDVVVGTSEAYDLSPICSLEDATNPQDEYVTELPVAIVSPDGASSEAVEAKDAAAEDAGEKEGGADDNAEAPESKEIEEKSKEDDDKKESVSLIKPVATLTLKLVFKPSVKDQKEELYELLNKMSQQKSDALKRLREQQTALTKQSGSASPKKSGAVKAGFLNKKPKKAEESKWKQMYDKYMGPQSMARAFVIPITKNYVIFFGAAVLMHFKGQELALPAPV